MHLRGLGLGACLLLCACGTPAAERVQSREGQEVQADGPGAVEALWEADGALVVRTFERRSGLPPECRRYTGVEVLEQSGTQVRLAVTQYRPTWDVEPECPVVEGDPATHRVALRAPLGDRDVVDRASWPLHVQDRRTPGRTAVRGEPSCAEVAAVQPQGSADYRHFVRHDGRTYDAELPNEGAVLVGPPLGTVRCVLSGSLTPSYDYAFRDGDAGFLPVGTPYYAVEGRPVAEAVGAVWDGQPVVFEQRRD